MRLFLAIAAAASVLGGCVSVGGPCEADTQRLCLGLISHGHGEWKKCMADNKAELSPRCSETLNFSSATQDTLWSR